VKEKKGTRHDPYKVVPIPPKSVVRLPASKQARKQWPAKIGRLYRIGYYGGRGGLDCMWLVDENGQYCETIDHDFLFRWYDILVISEERNVYGKDKPELPPIRRADAIRE